MTCTDWPPTIDAVATKRDVEEAAERFIRQFGHYADDVRAHPATIWELALTLPPAHPPRGKRFALDLMGTRIREDPTVPHGVIRMALTPAPQPEPPPSDWHPTRSREIL